MDYRRSLQSGATYFFTVATEARQPILIDNIDRLRNAFRHVRQRHPFSIEAIVVLPDHLHTIWTLPQADANYSMRWMQIKRSFSTGLIATTRNQSKVKKREKGVWQRRFWEHLIRDERDWRNHMDYIHYNPVKHGYVHQVAQWPYSSFEWCVAKGWYEPGWGTNFRPEVVAMDLE